MAKKKFMIVGQAPSATSDPKSPLSGRSGAFLARCAGVSFEQIRDAFELVNLLPKHVGKAGKGDRVRRPTAREVERVVVRTRRKETVILLGRFVGRCVAGSAGPFFRPFMIGRCEAVIVPHPSGINVAYNDPANRKKLGAVIRKMMDGRKAA